MDIKVDNITNHILHKFPRGKKERMDVDELALMILGFMDHNTLLTSRLISTRFRALIDEKSFWKPPEHLERYKTAILEHPQSTSATYCERIMWYRKYVLYRSVWPLSFISLSLGELDTELQKLVAHEDSKKRSLLYAVKALIIGYDIPNLVLATHGPLLRESEVWKVIYGRLRLSLGKNEDLLAQFKSDFCVGSTLLKLYSAI